MLLYAIIQFAMTTVFAVIAMLIYRGKTELINDYHRRRVTDKTAYGKAFGKAMSLIPVGMFLGATVALFGEEFLWAAMVMLFGGILAGTVGIFRVQKKYNGGVFS